MEHDEWIEIAMGEPQAAPPAWPYVLAGLACVASAVLMAWLSWMVAGWLL